MEMVTIQRSFSPAEADLLCSFLRAAGLDADVAHAGAALSMDGYALAVGGVLVQVPEDQAARARALIESSLQDDDEGPV